MQGLYTHIETERAAKQKFSIVEFDPNSPHLLDIARSLLTQYPGAVFIPTIDFSGKRVVQHGWHRLPFPVSSVRIAIVHDAELLETYWKTRAKPLILENNNL